MIDLKIICPLAASLILSACATPSTTTSPDKIAELITLDEAKSEACPQSVLEAGASPEDCQCVETKLFLLGQVPGALKPVSEINDNIAPTPELDAGTAGKRKIAIGLLRLDAFEQCGLFDPGHIVSQNLGGT